MFGRESRTSERNIPIILISILSRIHVFLSFESTRNSRIYHRERKREREAWAKAPTRSTTMNVWKKRKKKERSEKEDEICRSKYFEWNNKFCFLLPNEPGFRCRS